MKLTLQYLFHAGTHKFDYLLWRVNDTVGIGLFDREALEKAFVDGIKKVLFLCPAIQCFGSSFNGDIKAVKRFFKIVAVEGTAGESLNDFLDFGGNDIAVGEVRIVENSAEETGSQ